MGSEFGHLASGRDHVIGFGNLHSQLPTGKVNEGKLDSLNDHMIHLTFAEIHLATRS